MDCEDDSLVQGREGRENALEVFVVVRIVGSVDSGQEVLPGRKIQLLENLGAIASELSELQHHVVHRVTDPVNALSYSFTGQIGQGRFSRTE